MKKSNLITDCPHFFLCGTAHYTGKCAKQCFDKYHKELGIKPTTARWKHRAEHNDFIWAECSNCGFREEAWKVVHIGRSDREYVGVKYKFCPMCGKPMGV